MRLLIHDSTLNPSTSQKLSHALRCRNAIKVLRVHQGIRIPGWFSSCVKTAIASTPYCSERSMVSGTMDAGWPIASATDNGANRNASVPSLKNHLAMLDYFAMQMFFG